MRFSLAVLAVEDKARWLEHFHCEESEAARQAAGEKSWQIFHVSQQADSIALLNEWEDEAQAMAFLTSEKLREFQQASGVTGEPQVFLFDEAEQGAL